MNNDKCPICDSDEFISSLCGYDILYFDSNKFTVWKHEFTDIENYEIYCRNCGIKINLEQSEKQRKIIIDDDS